MTTTTYDAWTVLVKYPEQTFFIGRYWKGDAIPPHMHGHVRAAYRTRDEARDALKGLAKIGKGRVVKVSVTMKLAKV